MARVAANEFLESRPAAAEDIAWLTDTFLVSLRDAITEVRGYWDEKKERDQFHSQLRLPDSCVLLKEASQVGFYTAWPASDHLFLGTLCVVPEYQNQGIGTAAMEMLKQKAAGLPLHFSVLKSNRAARRFYERLGCLRVSSTERHDHFVWPG